MDFNSPELKAQEGFSVDFVQCRFLIPLSPSSCLFIEFLPNPFFPDMGKQICEINIEASCIENLNFDQILILKDHMEATKSADRSLGNMLNRIYNS